MSFNELIAASVERKRKQFMVKVGDKEMPFVAVEYTATQRIQLAGIRQANEDFAAHLLLFCIEDQDGKHMTLSQIERLPEGIAAQFFFEACDACGLTAKAPEAPKA